MWRYWVAAGAALLLGVSAIFFFRGTAASEPRLPAVPAAAASDDGRAALPDRAPRASDRTREQRRFDRYDKDRDAAISREEYLASRRKAYARLDADGDGKLTFDEWAGKTSERFAGADRDKSGALTRDEFATTAPKRRAMPRCACPDAKGSAGDGDED